MSCFPNSFVCCHSKKAKQFSRHNSHMNLFMLIASRVTGDSKKGNDFFGGHHFYGQHNTISDVIDRYFMAAFTQFWLKTYMNVKYFKKTHGASANLPRHTVWETLTQRYLIHLTFGFFCFSFYGIFCIALSMVIFHLRKSKLYRYILDGTSALAWELPFSTCLGHLSST